jgi:hypothetical protein
MAATSRSGMGYAADQCVGDELKVRPFQCRMEIGARGAGAAGTAAPADAVTDPVR